MTPAAPFVSLLLDMRRPAAIAVVLVCLGGLLAVGAGCAGGPIWETPTPDATDFVLAKQKIHHAKLPPARGAMGTDEVMAIVDRVARRVAPAADRMCRRMYARGCDTIPWLPVQVVLDDRGVNAYAGPDNRVYVLGGLVPALGSDDELAAIIAHEYAHVMIGHVGKKMTNATGGVILGSLAGMLGGYALCPDCTSQPSYIQNWSDQGWQIGKQFGALAYSPEMEAEADHVSAYIVKQASYDLQAAGLVWVRFAREAFARTPTGIAAAHGFLATHPTIEYRIAAWRRTVAKARVQFRPRLIGE